MTERIVIIGRQLKELRPCSLLGAKGARLFTGVIARPILDQKDGPCWVRQHLLEKGYRRGAIEPAFLPSIKETAREELYPPDDSIPFTPFALA